MRKFLTACLLFLAVAAHADLISGTQGASGGAAAFQNTPTLQTGNYTAVCGDVVYASAPAVAANTALIVTLPTATSCNGKPVTVVKVDQTTGTVTVNAVGTDVINGTGTVNLNAWTQTVSIQGSNVTPGVWVPWGVGIESTPPYLGSIIDGNQATGMTASSDVVIAPFYAPVPVAVIGFRWFITTLTGVAQASFGIYDQNGKLLQSVPSLNVSGTGVLNTTMTVTNLGPGQYYVASQFSSNTLQVSATSPGGGNGALLSGKNTASAMGLPNPYVFGTGTLTFPNVAVLVAGGRTTR
jgi:hypothetical protein